MKYGEGRRLDKHGWTHIHVEGDAYERGFQHGYLVAEEIEEILRCLKYLTYFNTGKKWDFFVQEAENLFVPNIDKEFLAEIAGIADGARNSGADVTWQEILAWNGYEELVDYWWPLEKEGKFSSGERAPTGGCSAFVATGDATKDGKIVMAHNSWSEFETGQFSNLILDIKPSEGHQIVMQSFPGYIHSMTDFFVTGAGIMGAETTIGGFNCYDPDGAPEFCRVRKAMQYADNMGQFADIMMTHNNGGYANTWLLGNVKTGEIMRFELGLKYHKIDMKMDGYFIGFNAPLDPRIRNLECSNTGFADIRRHQGARQVRLTQLMEDEMLYGRIDVDVAKSILADHHDVYLMEENPCSRTVCGHYELDDRKYMCQPGRPLPFQPRGAVDGKVMDSDQAKELGFWARWGSSCGRPFDSEKFFKEHIQWRHLEGYLKDRPTQPWTEFKAGAHQ